MTSPALYEKLFRLLKHLRQQRGKHRLIADAPVVAEAVFVQVGLQILLADRMIDAADPALDKAPESFNRIRVSVAHDIHALRVLNAAMNVPVRVLRQLVIDRIFVCVDDALGKHLLRNDRKNGLAVYVGSHDSNHASAALDHAEYRSLAVTLGRSSTAAAFTDVLVLVFAADIHLVCFYCGPLQSDVFRHQGSNLLEHAPRGFVGDADFALDLLCGDSAAGCRHEVHRIEPQPQRSARLLKDRPGHRRNHRAAVVAGIDLAGRNTVKLPLDVAIGAEGNIAGVPLRHQPVQARIVIRKHPIELLNREPKLLRNRLFKLHVIQYEPKITCRQGIFTFAVNRF